MNLFGLGFLDVGQIFKKTPQDERKAQRNSATQSDLSVETTDPKTHLKP